MANYSYSVEVDSGLKPSGKNTFPLAQAKDIAVDATGKRLDAKLAEQDSEISKIKAGVENAGSAEIPFFDLAAMGLPDVPFNGAAALAMDMSEIVAAHEKGLARMAINVEGVGRYEFVATALTQGLKFFYALYGTGRIQVVLTDSGIMVGVFETLPLVTDDDNGKVLTVADGRWAAAEAAGGGSDFTIPVYDFPAMGLPPIVVGGDAVMLETDTTQLMQDLENGVVTFKANFSMGDMTLPAVKTCGGFSSNEAGIATITGIDVVGDIMVQSVIMIQEGVVIAMAHLLDTMINAMIDAYMEDALGGDY